MSNRRLLLADDSLTIQKVVNLTFSDEGFDVQTVGDGDSALAAIRETAPDIVLADVNMPGADGYFICQQLRSNETTSKIPVILLVGSFEPFDEAKAGLVGADAFLTKPFQSIRQLISQVNELLAAVSSSNGHSAEQSPEEPLDDIASLYTQSFSADPAKDDEPNLEDSLSGFDDSGLDDEMIETSYLAADETPETLDFELVGNETAFGQSEEKNEPEPNNDQYYNDAIPVTTGYETSPLDPFTTPAEPESFSDATPVVEEQSNTAGENFVETLPNLHEFPLSEQRPFEAKDDIAAESAVDQFVFVEPTSADLEISQETVDQMGIETAGFEPPISERRFEEIDLLDLPSIDSNKTVELTTVERAELMGSDKQVVSISPELMEAIVQRVIEKMSQKY